MKIPANGFTHAGKFHADDVFATALLQILRPDIKITRGFTVPDDFDFPVQTVFTGDDGCAIKGLILFQKLVKGHKFYPP